MRNMAYTLYKYIFLCNVNCQVDIEMFVYLYAILDILLLYLA